MYQENIEMSEGMSDPDARTFISIYRSSRNRYLGLSVCLQPTLYILASCHQIEVEWLETNVGMSMS